MKGVLNCLVFVVAVAQKLVKVGNHYLFNFNRVSFLTASFIHV